MQFIHGSLPQAAFINIVWKDESFTYDDVINYRYFKNFDRDPSCPSK